MKRRKKRSFKKTFQAFTTLENKKIIAGYLRSPNRGHAANAAIKSFGNSFSVKITS